MRAFIHRPKSSTVRCRVFDPEFGKWWTGSAWTTTEAQASLTDLSVRVLADPELDIYYGEVPVPDGGWYAVEYLDAAGNVIKSESAVGSVAGVSPESALQDKVAALVQDVSGKLSASDLSQGIGHAVKQYSRHRPNEKALDVTGNAGHDYLLSGVSGWVDGFSAVRSIEYPVGSVPREVLDDDDWEFYRNTDGQALRLISHVVPATASFRLTFTIPHTDLTLPAQDLDAVASLAASVCLEILSTRYVDSSDPTIAADVVNYRSKSQEAASRAKQMMKLYKEHLGLKEDDSVPAASAVSSQELNYPGGGDRLTHPRSGRRLR